MYASPPDQLDVELNVNGALENAVSIWGDSSTERETVVAGKLNSCFKK